jgi:hypothetical protein
MKFPIQEELLNELKEKSRNSEKEICGFLIKKNNVYSEFVECFNSHPDPVNYFLISPKQCVFEDDSILFHSHPLHSDLIGFSDWDLENQQYFYLKMVVYSVKNNEFYYQTI